MPDYSIEPLLIPLDYQGTELSNQIIRIKPGTTIVGSDPRSSQSIIIRDPNVRAKHAVINYFDGFVSVTPLDGLLEVNGVPTTTTERLKDGFVLKVGGQQAFRFSTNQNKSQQQNYASPILSRKAE
uniref:FHA domain-containing protein n=1 Tax=Panagrolaimus sp. JU765 TaxID=591449 RepID=A0AC34RMM7_9BILA